jgi:hypothetical protein
MSTWTKRLLIAAMIAVPTLGFAVTKYRAHHQHHQACPLKSGCPFDRAQH